MSIKTTLLAFLLIVVCQSTFAATPESAPPTVRRWKAIVNCQDGKYKGLLYAVSDSSITLLQSGAQYTEIPFKNIDRIRLKKRNAVEDPALVGAIVGSVAGLVIGIATTPKRDEGDYYEEGSRTASAFLRGFLGSIIGTIIGAGIGWLFAALFGGKKFTVYHDASSYKVLQAKLKRYSMR